MCIVETFQGAHIDGARVDNIERPESLPRLPRFELLIRSNSGSGKIKDCKNPLYLRTRMSKLEKLVHDSYENLFSTDLEGTTYDDPSHVAILMPPRIVDESTLIAIDVKELFNAVNHTKTRTGAATLFRSLVQPLDSLALIQEKQSALKELERDKSKTEAPTTYLNTLAQKEPYVHRYLLPCLYCQNEPYSMRFIDQYELYREFMDFFKRMVYNAKN